MTTEKKYLKAVYGRNLGAPPVWFMRQAGRYHSHYQKLKEKYSFIELCKIPEVACEATMGPIRDFDFDAAILFSDLLFPLEAMGMRLEYQPGPKLYGHLKSTAAVEALRGGKAEGEALAKQLEFQAEALRLIRKELPKEKALLGFVGGPLTLFCYAVDGSHQSASTDAAAKDSSGLKAAGVRGKGLEDSALGLTDGRYLLFVDKLSEFLAQNMALQARAGADAVAMLDTCAGEFSVELYQKVVVPSIKTVLTRFKELCPNTPVVYYSKNTNPEYWQHLKGLPIDCKGIDWHPNLAETLRDWTKEWAIQGNIDPNWLFLETEELDQRVRKIFSEVALLPASVRSRWVFGLGHGVLPKTPEKNVRRLVQLAREYFGEKDQAQGVTWN